MKKSLLLLPLILVSCGSRKVSFTATTYAFSTLFDIRLFSGSQKDMDSIISIISDIETSLDSYNETGELYKLNKDSYLENPSSYLKEALSIGLDISNNVDTFSIYLGSLKEKWMDKLKENKVLDQETISAELEKISDTCIDISSSISKIGEAKIDLGAIGKGYCLDKIKQYLDKNNIHSYLISAGSSSSLFGDIDNDSYKVTLRDYPSREIYTKNSSMSISSIFEQEYKISGDTYSHIINPLNGDSRPMYSYFLILDENMDRDFPSTYIDGYSTALINKSKEFSIDFASRSDYKIAIGNDDIIYSSNGLF